MNGLIATTRPIFTDYDDRDKSYNLGIYNYSRGGSHMISYEKMEIDQQVYIKVRNKDQIKKNNEKYENYTGYVRWSSELGTSYPAGQYGYGIEYDNPMIY